MKGIHLYALALYAYLSCESVIRVQSAEISDNFVYFEGIDSFEYNIVSWKCTVDDFTVAKGEPSNVHLGTVLQGKGPLIRINFRVASHESEDVAKWYINQLTNDTSTTHSNAPKKLNFAFRIRLNLTLSEKWSPAKQHEIEFKDLLIAQDSWTHKWWLGGTKCHFVASDEIACIGESKDRRGYVLTYTKSKGDLITFLRLNSIDDDKLLRDNFVKIIPYKDVLDHSKDFQYHIVNWKFTVDDIRVAKGQPVHIGTVLKGNGSVLMNLRVGSEESEDVANWFNNQCENRKCTMHMKPTEKLNFAFRGKLTLTLSYNWLPAKQREINFHNILIAEASGSDEYGNLAWRFGGKQCLKTKSDVVYEEVICPGVSKDGTQYTLNFFKNNDNLFEIYKLRITNWMKNIDNDKLLSEINIPGSHESGTYKYNGFWEKNVEDHRTIKTQGMTITGQLFSGIRFLDIGIQRSDGQFKVYKDGSEVGLLFDDVLMQCENFLKSYPSETIVMMVREENRGKAFHQKFLSYVDSRVKKHGDYWYRGNTVPKLKDARGKIVLLYRFPFPSRSFGINVAPWQDNKIFSTPLVGNFTLMAQDEHYVGFFDGFEDKFKTIEKMINLTSEMKPKTWYINYLTIEPNILDGTARVGRAFNSGVEDLIDKNHPRFLGTMLMNYPEKSMNFVWKIISYNDQLNN